MKQKILNWWRLNGYGTVLKRKYNTLKDMIVAATKYTGIIIYASVILAIIQNIVDKLI